MRNKSMIKVLAGICLLVIICLGMYVVLDRMDKGSAVKSTKDDDEVEEVIKPAGYVKLFGQKYKYYNNLKTYLMLGTDASGDETKTGKDYVGNMADFLLLVVVDETNGKYATLQLNRDTMAEVDLMQTDGTAYASAREQICTAHWYGGSSEQSGENTVNAVSKLLGGISIDGYYAINMTTIPKLNHAVGGVTLTVNGDFSKDNPSLVNGKTMKLTDEQAFSYVHDRYGVDNGENLSRMRRQKQYMAAFLEKVKEKVSKDNNFGLNLYNKLSDVAVTNISSGELTGLLGNMSSYKKNGAYELAGKTRLGKALGDGIDHMEFYPAKKSVVDTMTTLYDLRK